MVLSGAGVRRGNSISLSLNGLAECRMCATVPDMDYIALIYYACVCAVLSLLAPRLRRNVSRLAVGAVVGLIAASCLPFLKGVLNSLPA